MRPNAERADRNGRRLAETGAIGCNFEDQVVGTDRLYDDRGPGRADRRLREGVGDDFFINLRTDLFLKAPARLMTCAGRPGDRARQGLCRRRRQRLFHSGPGQPRAGRADRRSRQRASQCDAPAERAGPGGVGKRGNCPGQPRPFPYMAMQEWLHGEAHSGAGLGATNLHHGARTGLQHRLAEQLRADPQDQRDPKRLPQRWRRGGATLGLLRRAGEHHHRRGQGEDGGGERLR